MKSLQEKGGRLLWRGTPLGEVTHEALIAIIRGLMAELEMAREWRAAHEAFIKANLCLREAEAKLLEPPRNTAEQSKGTQDE